MQLKTKLLVYITVPIALAVCISSYMTYRTHSAAMRHVIEKDIKAISPVEVVKRTAPAAVVMVLTLYFLV